MSEMKCPICGNDLERYHSGLVCYRHCLNGKNVWGGEETLKELDRTRKALDVALCSLQDIAESNGDFITGASTTLDAQEYAEMMLDKIKFALEQKDVK